MRTKTLLFAAAVAAAGMATSSAQVYSVNAVGYVNVEAPAGFSMIANPLNMGGNTLNEILPNVPLGTTLFKYDGTAFSSSTFIVNWTPNLTLNPGEGAFLNVTEPTTLTFVGEVPQGQLENPIPAGFSIRASQVPQSGNLDTDLNFPAELGDTVFFYRNGAYTSSTFIAGFNPPAVPAVGESFFVNKASPATWTRDFSVNQ